VAVGVRPELQSARLVHDARGSTWSYAYDAECNLVQITDPASLGTVSTRSYDGSGQLTGAVDRTGRAATFAYDPGGNLVTLTDGLANSTTLEYDAANR